MGELHGAAEIAHLSRQHDPGSHAELLYEPLLDVKKRSGHSVSARPDRDDQVLLFGALWHLACHRPGNRVDERDVLAGRRPLVADTTHRRTLDIAARIVTQ